MKISETATNNKKLYNGKPRGYYDPTPVEVFFTKVGQYTNLQITINIKH